MVEPFAVPRIKLPALSPMHPTLVCEPFHRDGWVYEEKHDGWRIVAYKDGNGVRLISRNGRDHTACFPDIAGAVAELRERLRERPTPACAVVERGHGKQEPATSVDHVTPLLLAPDRGLDPTNLKSSCWRHQRAKQ